MSYTKTIWKNGEPPSINEDNLNKIETELESLSNAVDALGSASLANTGTGVDDVPTNADLGSASLVNTGTGVDDVPTNADLGSASLANVGTGEAEVPTNADLGSASLANTGTGVDDVPTNDDIGANPISIAGSQTLDARLVRNIFLLPEGSDDPATLEDGDIIIEYVE